MQRTRLATVAAATVLAWAAAATAANLIPGGDFENPTPAGQLQEWPALPAKAKIVGQPGQRHLEIASTAEVDLKFPVQKDWKQMHISVRMRVQGMKPGKESWQIAKVMVRFDETMQGGKQWYQPGPEVRTDTDWVTIENTFEVSEGAGVMVIAPAMFADAGVAEFDDLVVQPVDAKLAAEIATRQFTKKLFPLDSGKPADILTFTKLDASGKPQGWDNWDPGTMQIVSVDGKPSLKVTTTARAHRTANAMFTFPESWPAAKVKARIRGIVTEKGPEGWNLPRMMAIAIDNTGKQVGDWPNIQINQTSDWHEAECIINRAPGAVGIKLEAGVMNAIGEFQISDLRIEPLGVAGFPLATSTWPKPYWDQEKVVAISPTRGEIVLNGIWQFMPAIGPAATKPEGDWGWIWVPGTWASGEWGRSSRLPAFEAVGSSPAWRAFDFKDNKRGWYHRPLNVPAEWIGRKITIDFARISTDATLFINNREAGKLSWPGGEIDITKFVKAGENDLQMLVVATPDPKESANLMGVGEGQVSKVKTKLECRGIIGDVVLKSEPAGARVTDVFVQTYLTNGPSVVLDTELSDVQQPGTAHVVARMLDEQGNQEKRFEVDVPVEAKSAQRIPLTFKWENPRLWDFGKPNLYTLKLEVTGAGIKDEYVQSFGFREFRIGKDTIKAKDLDQGQVPERLKFYLNGTEVRLRPVCVEQSYDIPNGTRALFEGAIDGFRYVGFNVGEVWPIPDAYRRSGMPDVRDMWYDVADKKGFALLGAGPDSLDFVMDFSNWKTQWDSRKPEFAPFAEKWLKRIRNHPSILMYTTNANFFGHNQDQNPRYIGRQGWPTNKENRYTQVQAAGAEATAIIKQIDPTRPVFTHMGGQTFGDISATNHYLNFIPLQEREEWMGYWAQHGSTPYMAVEFGTPLSCSFMRGHMNGGFWGPEIGGAMVSEPLLTEFSAIYAGPKSYELETPQYRALIAEKFEKDQLYKYLGGRWTENAANTQIIEDLFIRNTWRTYRTLGLSGGLVPWSMGHGWITTGEDEMVTQPPFKPGERGPYFSQLSKRKLNLYRPVAGTEIIDSGRTLIANGSDTLAWIAGPKDAGYPLAPIPAGTNAPAAQPIPAWILKDHNFTAGERIAKQAVLINDGRSELPFEYTWTATVDGKKIDSGKGRGKLAPGSTRFEEIAFRAPSFKTLKSDGMIELQAKVGDISHTDRFAFRIFARPEKTDRTVLVFDPEGRTTQLLNRLGIKTVAWTGKSFKLPLIIGRNALSSGKPLPGDLEAYANAGGSVLLMAQDPRWMADYWGLRINQQVTRRAFPTQKDHPILAGLDAEDLRDWRGEGTLIAPYPEVADLTRESDYGWHWGNRGSITSAAIEKPHNSAWRSILECEFDLAYSPLLEMQTGAGKVLLCTLDLDGRTTTDPAADLLATRLVTYLSASSVPFPSDAGAPTGRPLRTLYLGDDAGETLLRNLGVQYTRGDAQPSDLMIASATTDPAKLRAHASAGGTVLVFPARAATPNVELVKNAYPAFDVPAWPIARGLSISDLHWRVPADAFLLKAGAGNFEVAAGGQLGLQRTGSGQIIYCQFDPDRYDADVKTYHRFTRWRQQHALATILANAGATFATDARIFHPKSPKSDLVPLAGEWNALITQPLSPSSSNTAAPPDPGVSAAAKSAIALAIDAPLPPAWSKVTMPAMWETLGGKWENLDGEVVFRKVVEIPEHLANQPLELHLGALDDFDDTFWDGKPVGRTDSTTPQFYAFQRVYKLSPEQATPGRHVLTIRIFDHFGGGGFNSPADKLILRPLSRKELGFYHPDFRADHELGDDPARYKRW